MSDITNYVYIADKHFEQALKNALKIRKKNILLEELAQIEELEIIDTEISALEGIQHLCKLTNLTLENCRIVDITPLSHLVKLEELCLAGNKISDITPLQELPNLRLLILDCNKLDTTKFCPTMKIIRSLDERGCQVTYMIQDYEYIAPDLPSLEDNGEFLKCSAPSELAPIPNKGGIYFFYDNEFELLYVGKTAHLFDRITTHLNGHANTASISQFFDYVKFVLIEDADQRETYETYYINTLQPRLNIEKTFTYETDRFSFKYIYGDKWEKF